MKQLDLPLGRYTVFCCPVVKSVVMLGGLAVMGFAGWEASSYFSCCHQDQSIPYQLNGPSEGCCATDGDGSCCSAPSRAGLVATKPATTTEDCCEKEETAIPVSTNSPAAEGWTTVKGQVVFGGDTIPKAEESKVTADQAHCLAKGPLLDKVWNVNPSNKGLAGVVVFILPERDEKLPVHPDLQATPKPFTLDQPYCEFTPRVFAVQAGQTVNAKNPDPVLHNVVIKGLKNDLNVQIPSGSDKPIKLVAEANAITVACGSHPWMKGFAWCFDHPYFAVTDKDGKFEIKNVPAGNRKIVIWHETGYLPGYSKRDQKTLNLAPGATVDVGAVKAMPK